MSDFDDTPTETPEATLAEHRPYVLALANSIAPLQATVHTLMDILHELRVARDPIGEHTKRAIGLAGGELEKVGRGIRTAFGGG